MKQITLQSENLKLYFLNKTLGYIEENEKKTLLIVTLVLFVIKLTLFSYAQTTDPDAIVRILQSEEWSQNPHWIGANVWGPFNYYLNGLGLLLYENRVVVPKLISVLLSTFVVIPVYYFNKKFFTKVISFALVIVLSFCTMLFRNSFMAMSEIPYLFFVATSLYYLAHYFSTERIVNLLLSALAMTIASGFRYEAWAMMFCFFLILLFKRKIGHSIIFASVAGIFPLIWMISNHIYTGDFLFSLKGNQHWTQEVMKTNENVSLEGWLRRFWFLPFSCLVAVGPIFVYLFLSGFKNIEKALKVWLLPLIVMFGLLFYSSVNGTLLHHHRFILTIVLLGLPFVGNGLKQFNSSKKRIRLFTVGFIVMIAGTFIYNTDGIELVPRISDQTICEAGEYVAELPDQNTVLYIDFMEWDNTYYLGHISRLKRSQLYLIDGFELDEAKKEKLNKFETHSGQKILVVRKGNLNELQHVIDSSKLQLTIEGSNFYLYTTP